MERSKTRREEIKINKMKVLIAPNSMKGSLSAFDFADTVEKALLKSSGNFEIRKIPVADGGDLTREVLAKSFGAKTVEVRVKGPRGKVVMAKYAVKGNVAIIEMADASGMKLLQSGELNPMLTSSFGTGELIRNAVERGCNEILLAIGGSATVDGGLGMMRALGFVLLDKEDKELPGNGHDLLYLKKIQKSELLAGVKFRIICDVDNPLLGTNGAASVFGPQKGADAEMVMQLEAGLKNLSDILEKQCGKVLKNLEGAGAAGGLSLPLLAFADAEIVPGADYVCKKLDLEKWVKWADLVITGEGKIDGQTLNNKAPFAVAQLAGLYHKPVIAIAGKVEAEASAAFNGIFTLVNGPVTIEEAMQEAGKCLYQTAYELGKLISSVEKMRTD